MSWCFLKKKQREHFFQENSSIANYHWQQSRVVEFIGLADCRSTNYWLTSGDILFEGQDSVVVEILSYEYLPRVGSKGLCVYHSYWYSFSQFLQVSWQRNSLLFSFFVIVVFLWFPLDIIMLIWFLAQLLIEYVLLEKGLGYGLFEKTKNWNA